MVPGAVIGGLNQWEDPARRLARGGRRRGERRHRPDGRDGLIVGPGCVLAMETPDENVAAVVRKLGGPLKPIPGVKLD